MISEWNVDVLKYRWPRVPAPPRTTSEMRYDRCVFEVRPGMRLMSRVWEPSLSDIGVETCTLAHTGGRSIVVDREGLRRRIAESRTFRRALKDARLSAKAQLKLERSQANSLKRKEGAKKAAITRAVKSTAEGRLAYWLKEALRHSEAGRAHIYDCDHYGRIRHSRLRYQRKSEAIARAVLAAQQANILVWRQTDSATPVAPNIIYFELPVGQVSFHSSEMFGVGECQERRWSGRHDSAELINRYFNDHCDLAGNKGLRSACLR